MSEAGNPRQDAPRVPVPHALADQIRAPAHSRSDVRGKLEGSRRNACPSSARRRKHLHTLAGANTSLRWVGYEVHGLGLKAWDVARAGEHGWLLDGPALTETSESAGLAMLKRERMDQFRDVKPLHVVM